MVDEPNRSACFRVLADNRKLFQMERGSTNNHQAWPGGYFDHVQEIMNHTVYEYRVYQPIRPYPFPLGDPLVVSFFHDIEKPWKYELGADGQWHHTRHFETKAQAHAFRDKKMKEYGVVLTPEQENGMKYVEGEFEDYTNRHRVMGPLAALCHIADVRSARIDYDHPLAENDPWPGARRIRDCDGNV